MFREMRRKRQALSPEECGEILNRGSSGVLALLGDEGYPYALPISYVWDGERLYFHGAREGHKIDAIRACDKASFCVIDKDSILPEEFTTVFRSVIVFGRMRIVEDDGEKRSAVVKLARKYSPAEPAEAMNAAIDKSWRPLCILTLEPEHISGKMAIELMKQR